MNGYDLQKYALHGITALDSPCLVYYRDMIESNTRKAIAMAGSPERLWPHVKSHKAQALVRMQLGMGIRRFKCATIAEAEMAALCGAPDVLLAYPLLEPDIRRFILLREMFPATVFWAIGDDLGQLNLLGKAATGKGTPVPLLVDVNVGMDRTGVLPEALGAFYAACATMPGLALRGLHCYDGHIHDADPTGRQKEIDAYNMRLAPVIAELKAKRLLCDVFVMGGSPTFPCHVASGDGFLSPGTIFLWDHGYWSNYRDMDFEPAAALLTRVLSHPANGFFTVDAGSKAVASDPVPLRGVIVGMEEAASPAGQSEEHWVFRMTAGRETERPAVGSALYVIPTHICPTSALHPHAWVASCGRIVERWEITARNRRLQA